MANVIDRNDLQNTINALANDGELSQNDVNYLINYLISNGHTTGSPRDMIQIRRGNFSDLPNLAQGEMAIALDTKQMFIGGTDGNINILSNVDEQLADIGVSVASFGATGTGTNDTVAFQNAIASLPNGGTIIIPKGGVYPLSLTTSCNNIIFTGGGVIVPVNGMSDHALILTGEGNTIDNLVFKETTFCHHMLYIQGNKNRVINSTFYKDLKEVLDTVVYSDEYIFVSGNDNEINGNEIFHGRTGMRDGGKRNKLIYNYIHDNINGIQLLASCRNTEVAYNKIINNNVNSYQGADGILGTRNVSEASIHHNIVSNNGEHGIYFQGDSSTIESNTVTNNFKEGIKLASYNTGLHEWDEASKGAYIGFNNSILNNITRYNGGDAIYLQSPLKNIAVRGNQCNDGNGGIRSVILTSGDTLDGVVVENNTALRNTGNDISIIGVNGTIIKNNVAKIIFLYADTLPRYNLNAVISFNDCDELNIQRCKGAIITNNIVRNRMLLNSNCLDIRFNYNTVFHSYSENIFAQPIIEMIGNYIEISGNRYINFGLTALKRFKNNHIKALELAVHYVLNFTFGTVTNGLEISGNTFELSNFRAFAIWGSNIQASNNIFIQNCAWTVDVYGTNNIISTNNSTGSATSINLRDAVGGNIVIGNNLGITNGGSSNIITGNRV